MSDATKAREADPWWGTTESAITPEPEPAPRPRATTPRRRSSRAGALPFVFGILLAPLWLVGRIVRRSPRIRSMLLKLAVVAAILAMLTCSVGVILINNIVVGRTAELGELEDQRRELRRDNALLGAQKARLEAPDVVYKRAQRLGMVATQDVPDFVYLFGKSRTMNARQRQRVTAHAARRQQANAAVAKEGADGDGASKQSTGDTK